MHVKKKIAAVGAGAVALCTMIGVGVSYADNPSAPTPSATASTPSAAASAQPKQGDKTHARRALLKRALHGEVTVGGAKQTRVVVFQRGAVQNVNSTAVTLKSIDGFTATYVVNADTRVRKDGSPATIGDIGAGDTVRVVALKNGATATARLVAEPKK